MKKSLFAIPLLLAMVISVTSCDKSTDGRKETAGQPSQQSQKALSSEDEYSRLLESQKKADEEALANMEANFQPVDVNIEDPFEGL